MSLPDIGMHDLIPTNLPQLEIDVVFLFQRHQSMSSQNYPMRYYCNKAWITTGHITIDAIQLNSPVCTLTLFQSNMFSIPVVRLL